MTLSRQTVFWLAVLAALLLVLFLFGNILLPFVAGAFIAYLLNPVVRRLERLGMRRVVGTTLIVLVFLLALVLVLLLVVPALVHEAASLIDALPGYATQLENYIGARGEGGRLARLLDIDAKRLQEAIQTMVSQGAKWLGTAMVSLWEGGQAVVETLGLVVVTPVIAFYLLLDWNRMIATADAYVPRDHVETVHALVAEMDHAVSGFIHGQLAVALLLGIFYAVALLAVGLDHALLIGLGAGLISIVPYLGSVSGFVVSMAVAIGQFWPHFLPIGAVALVYVAGQFIEGNVLQPKLVGNRVGLHPVWLIFALFAAASLFGFAGMLIAIPAAAAIAVLIRHGLSRYRKSPYFKGSAASASEADGD